MSFQEVFAKVKEKISKYNGNHDFLAVQVTLKDLNQVLYVEIKNGNICAEPYEYNDRQANIIISSKNFMKLMNKELNPIFAFTVGKLKVEGDVGKAVEIAKLFE